MKQFVIIDQQTVEFSPELNVVTGETGSGKSIMLDAIAQVLGARVDASLVQHGTTGATVTATFDAITDEVKAILQEQDIDISDDESLILRRHISADGKSKAFINDQPVSLSLLKTLGEALIDVHRQFDHQLLKNSHYYIDVLDLYAGLTKERDEVATLYRSWQKALKEYNDAKQAIAKAEKERDYLSFVLEELTQLDPKPEEEAGLADLRQKLMQQSKFVEQIESIEQALREQSPAASLNQLASMLSNLPEAFEEETKQAVDTVERALIEAQEAEHALSSLNQLLSGGGESLDEVEERLFALRAAARKHQCQPDELAEKMQTIASDLQAIESQEEILHALEKTITETQVAFVEKAEKLSKKRVQAAKKLERAVLDECKPLKLENMQCEIRVEKQLAEKANSHGLDEITFLVSMNPGTPLKPLHEVASGGEMSRLMLALLSITGSQYGIPTMIFDEIDTGVGGAVADAVGRRLKELSTSTQIFTITHHPQVAAFADQHIKVSKQVVKQQTKANIQALSEKERKEEIARMLAGAEVTSEAKAAAEQLMVAKT